MRKTLCLSAVLVCFALVLSLFISAAPAVAKDKPGKQAKAGMTLSQDRTAGMSCAIDCGGGFEVDSYASSLYDCCVQCAFICNMSCEATDGHGTISC